MFADLIINFSMCGVLVAFIIGCLVCKLSDRIEKIVPQKSLFLNCLLLYFSYAVLLYARGSAQDLGLGIKRCIYMMVVYFILEKAVFTRSHNKKVEKQNEFRI